MGVPIVPRNAWLHSSDPAARWNFAGERPDLVVMFDRDVGTVTDATGRVIKRSADPFELIDWMVAHPDNRRRWIGYVGYGLRTFIEAVPANVADDLQLPLLAFGRFEAAGQPPEYACETPSPSAAIQLHRNTNRSEYRAAVERTLDYIAAGDVFQVNLSQRIDARGVGLPCSVWQRLITQSPATYGAYLELSDSTAILSNSPELFFRIEPTSDGSRRIISRPIKGTRPHSVGMREALEHSAKDKAELAMIVDLQRNDLGRVCELGSVRVVVDREIETHPTVYHGVATIEGRLRPAVTLSDILRAMFPCGSITGCPKIRAMEIIDELEPVARGPYCGAIGYIDPDGTIEFNVAIRTMTIANGVAHIPVGGGIVADSTPPEEHEETLVKAAAMLDALGIHPAALSSD